MGQGSIGGALINAHSTAREIDRAKKIDQMNWKNQVDSWKRSDLFPFAFGGGSEGMLTTLGNEYDSILSGIRGLDLDVGNRVSALTGVADRARPLQAKADELSAGLLSGSIGDVRRESSAPIYQARTDAANAGRSASIEAMHTILNRIAAKGRAGGFTSGDSLAENLIGSDAARQIANQFAQQLSSALVQNATDQANLEQAILNEQLSARGVPLEMLQANATFDTLPENLGVASALAPLSAFTSAVSPYRSPNAPPARVINHYPSEATLYNKIGADALDMIEKLGWSVLQSYMGGGAGGAGGMLGGMMGGGGQPTGDNPGGGAVNFNYGGYLDRAGADRLGTR